jgi:predicted phosphoribosyltransferase
MQGQQLAEHLTVELSGNDRLVLALPRGVPVAYEIAMVLKVTWG